jgi:hypothetical protein
MCRQPKERTEKMYSDIIISETTQLYIVIVVMF